jgi:hypothetical protein
MMIEGYRIRDLPSNRATRHHAVTRSTSQVFRRIVVPVTKADPEGGGALCGPGVTPQLVASAT